MASLARRPTGLDTDCVGRAAFPLEPPGRTWGHTYKAGLDRNLCSPVVVLLGMTNQAACCSYTNPCRNSENKGQRRQKGPERPTWYIRRDKGCQELSVPGLLKKYVDN